MNKFEFYDIMFPNQEQASTYYQGDRSELNKRIYEMACRYSTNEEIEIKELEFPKDFPAQQYMGASPVVQSFQHFLLTLIQAKKVLEIGTFVGCSTIRMAKTIAKWGGEIHTVEKYDVFAEIAKKNFEKMQCKNIKLLQGDAFEIIGGGGIK